MIWKPSDWFVVWLNSFLPFDLVCHFTHLTENPLKLQCCLLTSLSRAVCEYLRVRYLAERYLDEGYLRCTESWLGTSPYNQNTFQIVGHTWACTSNYFPSDWLYFYITKLYTKQPVTVDPSQSDLFKVWIQQPPALLYSQRFPQQVHILHSFVW